MVRDLKSMEMSVRSDRVTALMGYIEIARTDHWFKNVFMLFGVLFAVFHNPSVLSWQHLPGLIVATIATCLLASSNYVLNEIQDAAHDQFHPQKKHRPIPSGRVKVSFAYMEWILLAFMGVVCLILAFWLRKRG